MNVITTNIHGLIETMALLNVKNSMNVDETLTGRLPCNHMEHTADLDNNSSLTGAAGESST